ncbi:MAG: ABC transporter ATP-binding protein [Candidatus Dormibacteraeota bacterium]|nr:ABC transporter ATP-binding protein [Candidatus Dormibacteraeota bacterium]
MGEGPVTEAAEPLVEVQGLRTWFPVHAGVMRRAVAHVHAVDGVDLQVMRGETLGLVGESGCGKSTLGRSILRLVEPTSGRVLFKGQDVGGLRGSALRRARRDMAMIFQDPFASLDPRQTVGEIVAEPLDIHGLYSSREDRRRRVEELLEVVGLSRNLANRYPHEFSGGQRQRVGIARALAVDPAFIVCDEPVSALDVSIQAQIVKLLVGLQEQFHLTYLFIAHDLSLLQHIADRIAVMYLGKVVEVAPAAELRRKATHPYTVSLLSAIPVPDPRVERERRRIILAGDVPSPVSPPSGCRFRTRCFKAQDRCAEEEPSLDTVKQDGHSAACFFPVA